MICGSRREGYDEEDEDDSYRRRPMPAKNYARPYNTNTNGGRTNPGFVADGYNRNNPLPNRVYI